MGETLIDITRKLSTPTIIRKRVAERTKEIEETKPVPKVQLIYAFNGTGKTRLSREFKRLINPKADGDATSNPPESNRLKVLYYNAFTEDLFYWISDDDGPTLRIQPNSFTEWLITVLKDLGQDGNIAKYFQRYTTDKLTPLFDPDFSKVQFTFRQENAESTGPIKISKGEESNFIWSVFYTLLNQVVTILNVVEPNERENREFDQLEYVFIDDPVSSLDENHLIELAVNLAGLIKSAPPELKFIVTTHSPLFYNVLYNELSTKTGYLLELLDDGTFTLTEKAGDSNRSFSYHLHLMQVIEKAIAENRVEKFHFTLLRNLYEKTASFLGYRQWSDLLPDDRQLYLNRVIQFTSHSTLSDETVSEPTPQEKAVVKFLLDHLKVNHRYWSQEPHHG